MKAEKNPNLKKDILENSSLTDIQDALYVAGMLLLNEKALEVKEVGKRRCKCNLM